MPASRFDLLTHHEAGHAAIAYSFALRLERVRIDVSTYDGLTTLAEGMRPTRLQHVLILLAGGRAEAVLDRTSSPRSYAAVEDEFRLRNYLEDSFAHKAVQRSAGYFVGVTDRVDERVAECCHRLVVLHWKGIQGLARELGRAHEIGGAYAEAILDYERM